MKILITGATGLIGSELVALLLQNGISVNYLTTSKKKLANQPNYKGFYWNPVQGQIDENALLNVDTIVHLAGASIAKRWTKSYKQEIIESRILSINMLYKVLKNNAHQVTQIISASGIAIYPDSLTTIYTEENKSIENSYIGQVVVKWEESVDKFRQLNIKVCKLRTGIVLSNKGGAMSEMIKPIRLGVGSPFGTGNQIQSWIHITDLASMYFFAIQNQWEGIFNAVAPNPVNNKTLLKSIAKKLKKPFFLPNIPEFIMQMVLGEMHQILFTSQNISAEKTISHGFTFKFKTLEKALEDLL